MLTASEDKDYKLANCSIPNKIRKMKTKKLLVVYIVLLALAVATMINLMPSANRTSTMQATKDYPEIKEEGVLRVITEYSLSGYFVNGDTISGFQYEMSQAISKESGLEIQTLLDMNLENSFEKLNKGECDVIARNIPITSELKEKYLFTEPIVLNKQVLVQRKSSDGKNQKPIRNHLELGGKTIYVPKGSPALQRLKNLSEEIGDTIYIKEDSLYSDEQLIIMVASGDIDFAVCDHQISEASLKDFSNIDIKTDISFTQLQAWAVRKNSPILKDSLDKWLGRIKGKGLYDRIYKRYYK